MAFLLGAGLLLVLILALLVWGVLRRPRKERDTDLRGRLEAELAGDVAAGVLPAEDLAEAVHDLDTESSRRSPSPVRAHAGPWVWALIVLIAIGASILYWQTGNWRAAINGDRAAVLHRADTMLQALQTHLKTHPNDENAWITLGHAKSEMGDYSAAAAAYKHAAMLDHEQDPDLLAAWGEALLLADPEHPTAYEGAIFAIVLKRDPDNIRGLWYAGLLALDAGKRDLAVAHWQRLLDQKIPAPMTAFIKSRLHELGVAATAAAPSVATSGPSIALTITIAPDIAAKIKPGETIFVYVRDPAGGPPLAARRVPAAKFPLQLTLANDDAMLAGRNLSSMIGKMVEVGVLVSASGNATPRTGDPVGSKHIELQASMQTLVLEINRVIGGGSGS
ncbi:MAG: c-type cytochrome biogenesis protein CcmI/CycH [Gammaproteobacteria bacterium]